MNSKNKTKKSNDERRPIQHITEKHTYKYTSSIRRVDILKIKIIYPN